MAARQDQQSVCVWGGEEFPVRFLNTERNKRRKDKLTILRICFFKWVKGDTASNPITGLGLDFDQVVKKCWPKMNKH